MFRKLRWMVMVAGLLLTPGVVFAATVVNEGFEAASGPFQIPEGWTPYGEAGYEGYWESSNWWAQVGDPPPSQRAGLYQVIPDTKPGAVYRLTAKVRGGGPQTPARIGLARRPVLEGQAIVWSEDHYANEDKVLEVQTVSGDSPLVILLDFRNENPDHYLIRRAKWDDISLNLVGKSEMPPVEQVRTEKLPAANDPYSSLANLWSLAWPKEGVSAHMAGTHDPDREGNADFNRYEDIIQEGTRTWYVLKTLDGPGFVTRLWLTWFASLPKQDIRIEIDGNTAWSGSLTKFFGMDGTLEAPLTNRTSGGWMSYLPMPYQEKARILISGPIEGSFYWQINYTTCEDGEELPPFQWPLPERERKLLDRINAQWITASMDPKPLLPNGNSDEQIVRVRNATETVAWSQAGTGVIGAVRIRFPEMTDALSTGVRLQAWWDGEEQPSIDAPLGVLVGMGDRIRVTRGLLAGYEPVQGFYFYFPMHFEKGAKIVLVNDTGAGLDDVDVRVDWHRPGAAGLSPLRFHAKGVADEMAGKDALFVPVDVKGRGQFVGYSALMAAGNKPDVHYLEGDEYFFVDGDSEPVWAGTGTEDYFTCGWYFFGGAISLAPVGAPYVGRDDKRVMAYRFHPLDWVPFSESLRFGIEVGDRTSSDEYANFSTVSYYYLEKSEE